MVQEQRPRADHNRYSCLSENALGGGQLAHLLLLRLQPPRLGDGVGMALLQPLLLLHRTPPRRLGLFGGASPLVLDRFLRRRRLLRRRTLLAPHRLEAL